MNAIEVKNLKKYFGKTHAVDGVSFSVEKGEVFGFLGPNGAGKTTTIRCIMDFIRPDAGSIKILGEDSHKEYVGAKEKIGFLAGEVNLYDHWTGKDHIDFLESIRGKSKIKNKLIKNLDFDPAKRSRDLSSGNKQKLGIILALMHEPEIIILDEPTASLDPLLQNEIYKFLQDFQKQGKTIFMSSHNLHEVEKICGRVAIIKAGKLVAVENIKNLKEKKIYEVIATFEKSYNKNDFKNNGFEIKEISPSSISIEAKGDINNLLKILAKNNIKDIEINHASLEDIFLEFYERK